MRPAKIMQKNKPRHYRPAMSIFIMWSLAWLLIFLNFAYITWDIETKLQNTELPLLQQKLVAQANMKVTGLEKVLDQKKPAYTQKEIEDYIKVIFGKDAKVAIAVSHHECNPKNPKYPRCVLHTDKEYSVGVFQINLFNAKHSIHALKVPGKTMEEKIESLKDPMINILVAHKIFADSNGFSPWSAYSNGSYKQALAKGGE